MRAARHQRRAEMSEIRREEKEDEKAEKKEKGEKGEKHEKREPTVAGLLAGGFIIFFLGFVFYLEIMGYIPSEVAWPLWWLAVIVVLIGLSLYGRRLVRKRLPKT